MAIMSANNTTVQKLLIFEINTVPSTPIIKSKVSVLNNIPDFRSLVSLHTITTEEGVIMFLNNQNHLVMYNLEGIDTNIPDAYPYLRLNT
jgi:hypothetical protein